MSELTSPEEEALMRLIQQGRGKEARRVMCYLDPQIPDSAAGRFPFNTPTAYLSTSQSRIESMLAPVSERRKRAAGLAAK